MPILVKKSINVPQYYKDFIEENKIKCERAKITVDELTAAIASKRSAIVPDIDKFKYPVIDYPEFQQNILMVVLKMQLKVCLKTNVKTQR